VLHQIPENEHVIQYEHMKEFQNYLLMAIEYAPGGTLGDLKKR